ncbi:MAG: PKD domain-containing protein [Deltaproteobacteria bacterium]|nr:PKD domain-containing protein [Deltaproteobacteria bacterium]
MLKRIRSLTLAPVFLLVFAFAAHAAPLPVFGAKSYPRTTGKPDAYPDSFAVCNASAEKEDHKKTGKDDNDSGPASYVLIVENGANGANRLSSASVTLNGKEVVKEKDLNMKIGRVEKAVTIRPSNALTARVEGKPGGFIRVSVVCASGCMDVKITESASPGPLDNPETMVKGMITGANGGSGVSLSASFAELHGMSLPAETSGDRFAGLAPLQPGENTVTAIATDDCGQKAADTVTLAGTSGEWPLSLDASPSSGVLPDTGALRVNMTANALNNKVAANYSWDVDGDGIADHEGLVLTAVSADYGAPGLYFPKVTMTDAQGNASSAVKVVNVMSRTALDAALRAKWDAMRSNLAAGKVEKAVGYIAEQARPMFRYNFALMSTKLPLITQDMGPLSFVKAAENSAFYEMTATQDGKTLSFHIEFARDKDGVWRIRFF